jgi:ADP-heptose:LPS heptosyltransferase
MNILVVRRHNQIGDMLCSLYLYKALKLKYPDSLITLVASPTNYLIPFQKMIPFIDDVIYYDKTSIKTIFRFYKILRQKNYKIGIVPSTVKVSTTSHIINFLSGAKLRVGVKSIDGIKNSASSLLNIKSDFNWTINKIHQTERNLDIARLAGCELNGTNKEFRLKFLQEDLDLANNFIKQNFPDTKKLIIGFHPGAGKQNHIWNPDNFVSLIEELYKRYNNYVLITCGEIDKEIINIILAALNQKNIRFILAENMSVLHLGAVLERLNLYITNDTGPMHIAGMTPVKQISLVLPANVFEWAPKGDNKYSVISDQDNINTIKMEEVLELSIKLLAG